MSPKITTRRRGGSWYASIGPIESRGWDEESALHALKRDLREIADKAASMAFQLHVASAAKRDVP